MRLVYFALLALLLSALSVACQAFENRGEEARTPTPSATATPPARDAGVGDPVGRQPTVPQIQDRGAALRCEVSLDGGEAWAFDVCLGGTMTLSAQDDSAAAGEIKKEIEIVEYRNGDSVSGQSVHVDGVVHRDIAVRHIAVGDLDGDGYGDAARATGPTTDADGDGHADAARKPGRTTYANITLERGVAGSGDGDLYQWWKDAYDGKEIRKSITVVVAHADGDTTRYNFFECFPVSFRPWVVDGEASEPRSELTLGCPEVTVEASGGRKDMLEWLQAAAKDGEGRTLTMRETGSGLPTGRRQFQLIDAFPVGWSVDFSEAESSSVVHWTLEVRVDRIEMA